MGDRRCGPKASFGRWDRKPEGSSQKRESRGSEERVSAGRGKVPKQRPQTRGRKNELENGNTVQAGRERHGQRQRKLAEERELSRAGAPSGERHRLSPAMATVGPGSGGVRLRLRMQADQRAADAGVRE
jgi:hypothetical protein